MTSLRDYIEESLNVESQVGEYINEGKLVDVIKKIWNWLAKKSKKKKKKPLEKKEFQSRQPSDNIQNQDHVKVSEISINDFLKNSLGSEISPRIQRLVKNQNIQKVRIMQAYLKDDIYALSIFSKVEELPTSVTVSFLLKDITGNDSLIMYDINQYYDYKADLDDMVVMKAFLQKLVKIIKAGSYSQAASIVIAPKLYNTRASMLRKFGDFKEIVVDEELPYGVCNISDLKIW